MNGILVPEKKVKGIFLDFINIDIDILYNKDVVFEYEDFPENVKIENYVRDGIWYLKIEQNSNSFISKILGFSFNSFSHGDAKLKINNDIIDLNINSVSGDITLNDVSLEKLFLKTVSGDINIYNSKIKHLEYNSTSGDIETSNSIIDFIKVKTVSGDCEIDYLNSDFACSIKTVSGDIDLFVLGNDEINITKDSSLSGEIHSNIPLKVGGISEKRFINFKSVSGDLTIKSKKEEKHKNKEKKTTETNIESKLFTPEERKILELLKSKKISEEFAVELLENVGYTKEDAEIFLKENIEK
ncbi:DUF4097 and DUF4098 domain-containing protein YvlB [Marinitoga hydrogenitolerans DSM 16785]|uniref:DUF4097 and DUF4098 domain-containing protein YvlB n=1 Tax=Marinitoga hydrogenitolerans (strain DSM 16785 / JCM 12826 / AT1271) TaxID=1122195 RepID=A0A1M4XJY4_MARH1|nr:DUF4097 family beta strand repeat-containing protein [Marinitoga hydrogenitolerans]SHE93864.1 DUF4097 and DUF4098 domain-containing protein YvlB [Marinitoga hydrogenitolerans DSM 16785]